MTKLMHKTVFSVALIGLLWGAQAVQADQLADIKKAGVIKVAVFDGNPPFGSVDKTSRQIVGYDVDIANKIGEKLGVKITLVATNPANRIPLLVSKKADIIAANFTVTEQRAKEVDFSVAYFATGQKFIAKKCVLKVPQDIANLRIGADKGTVQEITLREQYPTAKVISYDDTPVAFTALRNGNVDAITQDDAKLIGLLANLPETVKVNFEISPFSITQEYQAVGISKGETALRAAIDAALLELEENGQAKEIYNRWFGPQTKAALPRGDFKFGAIP